MADITLRVDGYYIGSAFSPIVETEDSDGGHTVTITDFRGEHSYTVPDWSADEDARAASEQARQAAESARQQAEQTRVTGEQSRNNAMTSMSRAFNEQYQRMESSERARSEAEYSRGYSESVRVQAETARAQAEEERSTAEAARAAAEELRASSESERAAAEAVRVESEMVREQWFDDAVSGLASKPDADSTAPLLMAGGAISVLGGTVEEQLSTRRTEADGLAVVESVKGNTIVDAGTLKSVEMAGIETVGFNQWDEEWELGSILPSTGADTASSVKARSKNYIPVLPNTSYCLSVENAGRDGDYLYYYDADKAFISSAAFYHTTVDSVLETFTTPSGARYMRFIIRTPFTHACINLSDPALDGTYKPHEEHTRAIPASQYFPDGMRSAGGARDELRADVAVQRVGAVDLGTLNWTYRSANGIFYATLADKRPYVSLSSQAALVSDVYEFRGAIGISATDIPDMSVYNRASSDSQIVVRNAAYTDAAAFKAAMSGVMLYYELATPTTTPIDPPLTMTYPTARGGTVEALSEVPPVMATREPIDLLSRLEALEAALG